MSKPTEQDIERAERVIENAECAAQLEIKDQELRASLIRNMLPEFAALREEGYLAGLERAAQIALAPISEP